MNVASTTPPLSAGLTRWLRETRPAWAFALAVAVVSHIVFFALAFFASGTFAAGDPRPGVFEIWSRWDTGHFFRIANLGYDNPEFPYSRAFFPLYPLLLRALDAAGLSLLFAGLLLSAAAATVAFFYLYRLAERDYGLGAGRRAVLYLVLFPTGVFLFAPYSESLFLAGAIAAFYYARKSRWLAAGVPAAIAMGARAAGLFLLLGLAVEFVRQRRFSATRVRAAAVALIVGALPLVAYGLFLHISEGDALRFLTDQRLGWGREFSNPLNSFLSTWRTWDGGYSANFLFAWRIEILAAAIGSAFTVWSLIKREWGYAAFMGASMVALMTSNLYLSIPRLLLSLFPIVLFAAEWTTKSARRHELVLVSLAPLATLGVLVFTRSAWFF